MADEILNLVLAPQFEINVTHEMGGNANSGFTIVAGISASTGGMTDPQVKAAYERNANTNEFSDAEETKLAGIETAATTDQTNLEIRTAVGAAADSNIFTDMYLGVVVASASKLDGIETGATTDQTDAEIRTAVEAATDSNVFTDADHTKLGTIEDSATADQTGAEIKAAYEVEANAFTDALFTKLGGIDALAKAEANLVNPVTAGNYAWLTDVFLERDEANTLALRNGYLVPQMFRIYNTFTDATNYERANIGWDSGIFFIGTSADGTGSNRGIAFVTSDTSRWAIGINGDFIAWTDNVLDIGATGANRAKDFFLAGTLALQNATANKSAMIISGYSLTGANAQNMVDLSGTWNTTGAPTLIYANVVDTASDAGAMLINLKVGGTSMFSVTKAGLVTAISGIGMSDSEVKTAYENNADTNEFDDAEQTKLAGIETAADVTDAGNVASAGAIMDSDVSAGEGFLRKTGAGAYEAVKTNLGAATNPGVTNDGTEGYAVGSRWINTTLDKEFVCLDTTTGSAVWIETTAGGAMSDAEVKTAYENNADTNEFDDAEQTKLAGIETAATTDQTDGEIETAYNAQVPVVSGGEMTAGTEVNMRRFSPDNVENMIQIHAPSGSSGWTINDQTGTTYVLVLGDNQKLVRLTNAAGIALTIPTNASVNFPIGAQVRIAEYGAGTVTIDGAGVTLNAADDLILGTQHEGALLIKVATDEWDIIKDIQGSGMSDSEVKTAYENNADTNEFSDAEQTKLANIETAADVTDAGNVDAAGAIMDADVSAGEGILRKTGAGAYAAMKTNIGATTAPGATNDGTEGYVLGSLWIDTTADKVWVCVDITTDTAVWKDLSAASMSDAAIKTAYENNADTNEYDDAEQTKLGGIETAATIDQTDAEIRTAVEAATDSNVFTDADHTKLNAISDASVSTKTDDYTLVLGDAHNIIEMNKATAVVLKIPTNANEAYVIGTVVSIVTVGAGTCSITGDTGVTLNGVSAGSGDIAAQWDGVSIYKRGTDEWVVNGAIGDVT